MRLRPLLIREYRPEHMRALSTTTLACTALTTSNPTHIQKEHQHFGLLQLYRKGNIHYGIRTLLKISTQSIEMYLGNLLGNLLYEILLNPLHIGAFLIHILIGQRESLFHSYYNNVDGKAKPITELVTYFEEHGTSGLNVAQSDELCFSAEEWKSWSRKKQSEVLMNYRLAYLGETMVNWCATLGTVLANDEVSDGVSVRGGHPVEQKKMLQWCLRVSAYAGRLIDSLETLEWGDSLKESQRNWIGKSEGAEVRFPLLDEAGKEREESLTVFTTRADTIYGVTFMVLAPESDYVAKVTTPEQTQAVEKYLAATRRRTERDRMSDKRVSGVFSGSYAKNPLTGEPVPVWISDYVLAGYGTGAVMAVPAHDSRDFAFARHFSLPIIQVVVPEGEEATDPAEWTESKDSKAGVLINSGFLTGLSVKDAIAKMKEYVREANLGRVRTN